MAQIRIKTSQGWKKLDLGGNLVTEITYNDLKTALENEELVKGMYYRITDYVTVVNCPDVTSLGEQFDILVKATSKTTLSSDAYAVKHGTENAYFDSAMLDYWQIKYDLYAGGAYEWVQMSTILKIASEVVTLDTAKSLDWPASKYYAYVNEAGTKLYYSQASSPISGTAAWKNPKLLDATYDDSIIQDSTGELLLQIVSEGLVAQRSTSNDTKYYNSSCAEVPVYAWKSGSDIFYTTTITVGNDVETWASADLQITGSTTRFTKTQEEPDHKGVIYYMQDEHGNEACYDFKNIKWNNMFTFGGTTDDTLEGGSTGNVITSHFVDGVLIFPRIQAPADCHDNTFNNCLSITIDNKAKDNIFNKNQYLDIVAGTVITTASEYIKNYVFIAGFKGTSTARQAYTAAKVNDTKTLYVGFNTSDVVTTANLLDTSSPALMESLIFSELKDKIEQETLTPGMYYRITDYKTVATGDDVSVATDAYLPFDVVVLATSKNTIDENAFAHARESIVYPCDVAFENWQLKYCLHTDRFEWLQGTKTIKFPSSKECTEQNALTAPEEWFSLYYVDGTVPPPSVPIYKLMTADGSYGYGALESSLSAGMALLNKEDYLQKMIDSHYWNEEAWNNITVTSSTTIEVQDLDTFTRAPQYDFMPTDSSKWYAYLSSDGAFCQYTRHTIEDYATLTTDTSYFYTFTSEELKAAIISESQTDSVAEGTLPVSIENTGVISYMQDEWHNIAPYDFKNILYKGKWTFTNTYEEEGNSVSIDASLNSRREISKMTCSNNEIKSRIKELLWMLNRIIIEMDDVYIYNTLFEADCHSITINAQQAQLYYNRFSAMCCDMIINTQDSEGNQHNFDSCVFDQNTSTYTITGNSKTETPQITYISVVNEEVKYKHLADIVNTPTITTSTTEPTSPSEGDMWVDTNS